MSLFNRSLWAKTRNGGLRPAQQLRFSLLAERVSDPALKVQSYISASRDPFVNLSIEHFLLQKSHPTSTILFLYTNDPSIIIGRNQNPWLEVNLALLDVRDKADRSTHDIQPSALGKVLLVRRRSGGGTVFHDEGNVNWSIICPPADFRRDKHAEMVVRALRRLGVRRARVNERHDIVLDQGLDSGQRETENTHATPYMVNGSEAPQSLKVAGSAYKLTRARALHHGTCLLSSPNLAVIPHYLHSPAKPFIKSRGVESVSSPIGNIGIKNHVFEETVQSEFARMYGSSDKARFSPLDEGVLEIPEIRRGYEELKSPEWIYGQTPRFEFSTYPTEDDPRQRPTRPSNIKNPINVFLRVRSALITQAELSLNQAQTPNSLDWFNFKHLEGRPLHKLPNWVDIMEGHDESKNLFDTRAIGEWLNYLLPAPVME